MEQGSLIPRFSHRILLERALRRMRALLGLMTAAKALSTVQACFASSTLRSDSAEFQLDHGRFMGYGRSRRLAGLFRGAPE
jgi:hypothetical protein